MHKRYFWLAMSVMLLLACVPAITRAQEGAADAEIAGVFEDAPCFFDVPGNLRVGEDVICGYVTVPEDYAIPAGPTIRLAAVIFPDHSAQHQPDPVLTLSGGPGQKTTKDALAYRQLLAGLTRNRDLIVFDQRGAGNSLPALDCPEFIAQSLALFNEPDAETIVIGTYDGLMACRDRLIDEGINFAAYNTTQNAADVNAIRLALDYEQVNLFGGSYGTLLAQVTMRDYPAGIRSVVIDSVLPLEKSLIIESSLTASRSMMKLLESCESDAACSAAYPDLTDVFIEVADRLDADPVPMTLTSPVDGRQVESQFTGLRLRNNLFVFLYDTQVIPVLPQAIYDVYNGDYALMQQLSSLSLARYAQLSVGMEISMICTDDLIGYELADMLAIREELPLQLLDDGKLDDDIIATYSWFGICANWPVTEADPAVREPLVSAIPTLALTGEFDPITPPKYGELVVSRLSNGYFFEFPGVGHSVATSNACAQQMAAEFLNDPTVAPDASCIDDLPGVVFDLPVADAPVVLMPFSATRTGISGVAPAGWEEVAPAYYVRGESSIDQTQLVMDAAPISKTDFLEILAGQLQFDPATEPTQAAVEIGNFTWDLYALEMRGYAFDLALTEDDTRAYFALLISNIDERDTLYEAVFLPALESLVSTQ